MKQVKFISIIIILFIYGCVKDDFVDDEVDPLIRITTTVDTIAINTSFQFEAMYLNNVGTEEEAAVQWMSSQPAIISITNDGLAQALQFGSSNISVEYDDGSIVLMDSMVVNVGSTTSSPPQQRSGTVASTSTYALSGDFTLTEDGDNLNLAFSSDYMASTALPGLFIYLSNNSNTIGNALEIGAVKVFSGAHTYTIMNVGINDYKFVLYFCKPFNVKVGHGEIL
ncbi:MAG: hypothetical protein IH946_01925 [Bacteroidetes bacterium]|nr:hypothetical protein [Bacteroidota bacterium]